jgi:hypothetical protein
MLQAASIECVMLLSVFERSSGHCHLLKAHHLMPV